MTPSLMPTSSSYSSAEFMEIFIPIMVGACMIVGIVLLVAELYIKNTFHLTTDEKHVFFALALLFSPIWAPIGVGLYLVVSLLCILGVGIYLIGKYFSELGGACYRVCLHLPPPERRRPPPQPPVIEIPLPEIEIPIDPPTTTSETNSDVGLDIDLDIENGRNGG